MSIKNQNTHTNKKEVLERLNKLREDVFDYADYNHYSLYDYNVELTLNTLLIEYFLILKILNKCLAY